MNKIIVVICIFTIAFISFTVGYKYGDSNGYDAGYKEGYRYDCKEEIAALYNQVKAQKKVTEFAQESIKNILRENDSLKNPAYAQQRYNDSVALHEKYVQDSLRNWKQAQRKNDSLSRLVGSEMNYYAANGNFNYMLCAIPEVEQKVKECSMHKGFVEQLRKLK